MSIKTMVVMLVFALAATDLWADTWTDTRDKAIEATFESYDAKSRMVTLIREVDENEVKEYTRDNRITSLKTDKDGVLNVEKLKDKMRPSEF